MLLMAVICAAMGLVYAISPKTGWKISKSWQYKSEEPSEKALVWGRISGVALVVVAIILVVKYYNGG